MRDLCPSLLLSGYTLKVLWWQPECLQKPRQGGGTSYWPCPKQEPTGPVLHTLEPETAWETCWVPCAGCRATSLCDALDCAFHRDFFFFSLFSLVYLLWIVVRVLTLLVVQRLHSKMRKQPAWVGWGKDSVMIMGMLDDFLKGRL